MHQHLVKIKSIKHITHDVLQIITERPPHYSFNPGQATEVAINKKDWRNEKRPFTFTSLPDSDFLEFTIKTYPLHNGVTNELLQLEKDNELILHDVFGAIAYKGEGVFIAGGAGITPFICIFRYLQSKNETGGNKLIFANKTSDDIILALEFKKLLCGNFINILSDEKTGEYAHGQITEDFLKANITDFDQQFYVCGPPAMMVDIEEQLSNLGIEKEAITVEEM
jgi:ferredoxin-NADP reductase